MENIAFLDGFKNKYLKQCFSIFCHHYHHCHRCCQLDHCQVLTWPESSYNSPVSPHPPGCLGWPPLPLSCQTSAATGARSERCRRRSGRPAGGSVNTRIVVNVVCHLDTEIAPSPADRPYVRGWRSRTGGRPGVAGCPGRAPCCSRSCSQTNPSSRPVQA